MGKPEGKRPLGRPKYVWEDNMKNLLKKYVDWIQLAQGMKLWLPAINTVTKAHPNK